LHPALRGFAALKRSVVWVLESVGSFPGYFEGVLPVALMALVSAVASALSGVLLFLLLSWA